MSNKLRGDVSLEVGDTSYTLNFSANALCVLEGQYDEPFYKVLGRVEDSNNLKITDIRAILHAALLEHHPDTTQADAGRILTELGIGEATEPLVAAIMAAFPEAKAGGKKRRAVGTGKAT